MSKKAFLGYLLTFFIAIIIISNVNAIYINENGENIDFDQKIDVLLKIIQLFFHMLMANTDIIKTNLQDKI
jgi:hypothetical protein